MRPTLICSCLLLALVSACGGSGGSTAAAISDTNQPQAIGTAKSTLARNVAPQASDADLASAVAGNTEFALKVLPSLDAQGDSNLVYSPYSLTLALEMAAAGAKGDTLSGMEKALSFQLQQSRLQTALNRLDLLLAGKTSTAAKPNAQLPNLNIANALWAQQGYSLQGSYLDALGVNFGAAVNLLDFVKAAEPSRLTINNWVADQTQQKIKDLLPANSVSNMTRVVLTNAIWFKSDWALPFTKEGTKNQDFTDRKGSVKNVPFMNQTANFPYVQGKGYQAVELPYMDNKLAMLVVVPDAGKFDSFVQGLSSNTLADITTGLKDQYLALGMPKFNFSASPDMNSTLTNLGMGIAFDAARADFSGLTGNRDLSISGVLHKAYINVDEKGTEAAAATGVVIGTTSINVTQPLKLTLDRPFLFMIRDRQTGLVIFMGKLMNPAAS
ncbi:serpin family protein [Undibacterium sp. TS12]|uniref:serpin family protein n=1 Tax=Undibacterium sp. TS12 TaxID=2908202 RepID=UPI001F4C543F|nr:serpin family protein [Undibacterium sp. TS12]MCH8619302.1 serpin family protein [Undibacterium sp. TS12]